MYKMISPRKPFKATYLWEDLQNLFHTGMILKKHRYRFKTYNDCFTGSEAVEWLHDLLKSHRNFGSHVTKEQTIKLLKKFLRFHVIEDMNGSYGTEDFTTSRIFRLPDEAMKLRNNSQTDNLLGGFESKTIKTLTSNIKSPTLKQEPPFNPSARDALKSIFYERLQKVLHLDKEDDFLEELKTSEILDELEENTKSSLEACDPLPYWVLNIMKCLANWPNDRTLPAYDGFERDILGAVVDYFNSFSQPMISFCFYDIFIKIYKRCKTLDEVCRDSKHPIIKKDEAKTNSDNEVFNEIQKRLMQAKMRHENVASRKRRTKENCPPSKYGRIDQFQINSYGAFLNSNHQSMHNLSKIGEEVTEEDERYLTTNRCLSHHNLIDGSFRKSSSSQMINRSNESPRHKVIFQPLKKESAEDYELMSSVDNLLMNMSCGEVIDTNVIHHPINHQDIKDDSMSDQDFNKDLPLIKSLDILTADDLFDYFKASSASRSSLRRSNSIRTRKEVPPRVQKIERINSIKSREVQFPTENFVSKSAVLRRKNNLKRFASRPLSVIEQSPIKSEDHFHSNLLSRNCSMKPSHQLNLATKFRSVQDVNKCLSPLSIALKQAKQNEEHETHLVEALQLCLLILPQSNRRKLFLFLRFAKKVEMNPYLLHIGGTLAPREVLAEKFTASVISCDKDKKDDVDLEIFNFLLDHNDIIQEIPNFLSEDSIEERLKKLKEEEKIKTQKQVSLCKQVNLISPVHLLIFLS